MYEDLNYTKIKKTQKLLDKLYKAEYGETAYSFDGTLYPELLENDPKAVPFTVDRNSVAYENGVLVPANTPIYRNVDGRMGIWCEDACTNLFSANNSVAFETAETLTLAEGYYIVSIDKGTGKLVLSGDAEGECVAGSIPLTFQIGADGGEVTFTPVDGTPELCQLLKYSNEYTYKQTWQIGGTPRAKGGIEMDIDPLPAEWGMGFWFKPRWGINSNEDKNLSRNYRIFFTIQPDVTWDSNNHLQIIRWFGQNRVQLNYLCKGTNYYASNDLRWDAGDIIGVYIHFKAGKGYEYYMSKNGIVKCKNYKNPELPAIPNDFTKIRLGSSRFNSAANATFFDFRLDRENPDPNAFFGTKVVGEPLLLINFDDGMATDYTVAYQEMKARGLKGTSYIITGTVGTSYGGTRLTWAQIKEMYDSGVWDCQCHTNTHGDLTLKTAEEIKTEMETVNSMFTENGLPAPRHLSYPFGAYNQLVVDVVSQYRDTARTTIGTHENTYAVNPYEICCKGMKLDTDAGLEETKQMIDTAIQNNQILSLLYHAIEGADVVANFKKLLDYIVQTGIKTVTISELYEILKAGRY